MNKYPNKASKILKTKQRGLKKNPHVCKCGFIAKSGTELKRHRQVNLH